MRFQNDYQDKVQKFLIFFILRYLCVLAPNIISEKIFVFLWFWYALLLCIAAANVVLVALMAFHSAGIRSFFMMRAVFSRKASSTTQISFFFFCIATVIIEFRYRAATKNVGEKRFLNRHN